ncbi:MAG: putative quinol monooxygenase [Bacteroidales bacterium]
MKSKIVLSALIILFAALACKPKQAPIKVEGVPLTVVPADTQKMITAKVYIKAGHETEFIEAAKWIIENTHKEAGCLEYSLYQDPYNKSNFFFFERYKNQAAIDTHFAATYFKEFGTKIGDIVSQPTEIKISDISENK